MMDEKTNILELTANIVSAHISRNSVTIDLLPSLIQEVYQSLVTAGDSKIISTLTAPAPAVPIHKSVFPDFIVCLEDGKKLKMLKRYLMTNYNLTPDTYRAKWGLPPSYPMVAPSYASFRSQLAKESGLGRKPTPTTRRLPTHRGKGNRS